MKEGIRTIAASAIETDGLQIRAETSREYIDHLVELFDEDNPSWPADLPPLVVFCDGRKYWLADGHHRLAGAVQAGCTEIRVNIISGTKTEALLFACGANAAHGLQRTNADKQNAIRIAHQLMNPGTPARAIARICGVSHSAVNDYLRNLRQPKSELEESSISSENPESSPSESDCRAVADGKPSHEADDRESDSGDSVSSEACRADSAGSVEVPQSAENPPGDCGAGSVLSAEAQKALASVSIFVEIDKAILQLARQINVLAQQAGAELLRARYLKMTRETRDGQEVECFHSHDLDNLRREIAYWKPHGICPQCRAQPKQTCDVCKGLPYVTEAAFGRCSAELRKAANNLMQRAS